MRWSVPPVTWRANTCLQIGARLDNVYLDKELAGRIQQIQLLLATNTPADRKEKMWSQIESEMCLQRSKTIAQMCKTKQASGSRGQGKTFLVIGGHSSYSSGIHCLCR